MQVKDKINAIARLLFMRAGDWRPPGYDFQHSAYPDERMFYDLAYIAYGEIVGSVDLYALLPSLDKE